MGKSVLLEKIEECRKEMITLSHSHALTSEAVISSSLKLDRLINEYQNQVQ
ncbi:aspartyl-phosphate phosphatase Spo0E family protein [Virgibacillus sp. C22-A2]|uniref:Aspartyl-phosphate phosphatase Spo0E family protein n=1 Tax=Virgibacillus tibetensis TaxID=3042313 RepID=A0ABU6KLP3_9BACI|nr:aspartyl-phosphate phosphatase Spo0E family protein [Virgibacillus sp. C22-A2]